MQFQPVPVGIKDVKRGTLAPVLAPQRGRGADTGREGLKLLRRHVQSRVGVVRVGPRPRLIVEGQAQPERTGLEIGARTPARREF